MGHSTLLLPGSEINVLDHCSLSQDISAAHHLTSCKYWSSLGCSERESTDNQLSAAMWSVVHHQGRTHSTLWCDDSFCIFTSVELEIYQSKHTFYYLLN